MENWLHNSLAFLSLKVTQYQYCTVERSTLVTW